MKQHHKTGGFEEESKDEIEKISTCSGNSKLQIRPGKVLFFWNIVWYNIFT